VLYIDKKVILSFVTRLLKERWVKKMSGEFFLFFFGQCRFFAFRAPLGEFKGIHFLIIFRSSQNAANNICSLSVATDLKQLEALKVGP
jgi:hypothetical protein